MKTIIAIILSLITFPIFLIGEEADTGLEITLDASTDVTIVPAVIENTDTIFIKLLVVDFKKQCVYAIMSDNGKRIELVAPSEFATHSLVNTMKADVTTNIKNQYPAP